MGRHKVWRKIAKRERRRKVRIKAAVARDFSIAADTKEYEEWIKQQEALEQFELEQIEKQNEEENQKWLKAEELAILQWNKLQAKLEKRRMKELEEENRKRLEWELEQKKIKEAEEKMKQIEEEKRHNQEIFLERLEIFLSDGSKSPPSELMFSTETKPTRELCPFFAKTACCRFGDDCSRNHQYCGISKVLLVTNFYTHFGLENSNYNEYDTDLMLEYEDSDTYKDFKEFYYDVLPEFEKFGKVVQFKVCNNLERHLRGNTYVEFAELRAAVAAYRGLHARWYGGRQLSLRFCLIPSWRNAICGLQSSRRCPKGRSCNFLHVFKNPENKFDNYLNNTREHRIASPNSSWRWSESPEHEIRRSHQGSTSKNRARRRTSSQRERRKSQESYRSIRRQTRSRSRSPRYKRKRRKRRSRSPTPKTSATSRKENFVVDIKKTK